MSLYLVRGGEIRPVHVDPWTFPLLLQQKVRASATLSELGMPRPSQGLISRATGGKSITHHHC